MEIYSIGFTKHSALNFFGLIKEHEIDKLLDVRLNNTSQLSGFAKRDDLKYFLKELCNTDYIHAPALAPEKELLKNYRNEVISWEEYENRFIDLLAQRHIEHELDKGLFSGRTALLCSEHSPEFCHRRLVIEYLNSHWGNMSVTHLVSASL